LFELIKRHVKNPEILWLVKTIIFHNPTTDYYLKGDPRLFKLIPDYKSLFKVPASQGLPIGNLTSQFFANVYLNKLDQFVKHILKAKYYLRYVDDIVLLSKNKEQLKIWRNEIDKFLQNKLGLKLHPAKQILQDINKGLNFVGFIIKPDYVLMRHRIVANLKQKLWKFNQKPDKFIEPDIKQILATINSYYGQFKHVQTFNLRYKLWHNNFEKLQNYLKPADNNFSYFKIKNA